MRCHCGCTYFNSIGECTYCNWKGDSGKGKVLKDMGLNPDYHPSSKEWWRKAVSKATSIEAADSKLWTRKHRAKVRRECYDALKEEASHAHK